MNNNLSMYIGIKKTNVTKVSKDTGIARSTLHDLYHCKNQNPDTKTVMKLCLYFNITPNDFFGIEKEVNYHDATIKQWSQSTTS